MGGKIALESQLGKGTSLLITLPLNIATADDLAQDAAITHVDDERLNQLRNLRILVVDDLPANRQLLQQQLAFIGIEQVVTAENGAKACQILQHNNFDVVITDCSMPVMDGYELAAHIRQDPALKDLIVIGCTADAREESAARCIDAGMNACMIKPVAIDTLQATLLRKDIVSQIANTNTEDNDRGSNQSNLSEKNTAQQENAPAIHSTTITSSVNRLAAAQNKLRTLSGGNPAVELQLLQSLLESNLQDAVTLTQLYRQLCVEDEDVVETVDTADTVEDGETRGPGSTAGSDHIPHADIYKQMASLVHRIKGSVQLIDAQELVASCVKFESQLHAQNKQAAMTHGADCLALFIESNQLLVTLISQYPKAATEDSPQ